LPERLRRDWESPNPTPNANVHRNNNP
jgi:hypothetical protein